MKLSEAITKLQELQEVQGDLEIFDLDGYHIVNYSVFEKTESGWHVDGIFVSDGSDLGGHTLWDGLEKFVVPQSQY